MALWRLKRTDPNNPEAVVVYTGEVYDDKRKGAAKIKDYLAMISERDGFVYEADKVTDAVVTKV